MTGERQTRIYAAFAGAVIFGGTNFVAVSFSNMELAPLHGAGIRFALAAAIFFVIARMWRVGRPRGQAAFGAILYGLLAYGMAYALLYYALLGLSAGTVSIIMAAVPLFTLAIAVLLRQERLTIRGITGSLLVIGGIAVLSSGSLDGGLGLPFLLAAVGGAIAASASTVLAKALPNVHPVNMNAYGMSAGTVVLLIGSLALGEPWAVPQQASTWIAVAYLVALGSVGLFQLFFYVIRRWTASATVYAVAGMPLVAVALGALMLDQPVTPQILLGGAMVILAVYIGAISTSARARQAAPEAPSAAMEAPADRA